MDTAIDCIDRSLMVPVGDVLAFKDSVDKRLEVLIKAYFGLVGLAMQPIVASMEICETFLVWGK